MAEQDVAEQDVAGVDAAGLDAGGVALCERYAVADVDSHIIEPADL